MIVVVGTEVKTSGGGFMVGTATPCCSKAESLCCSKMVVMGQNLLVGRNEWRREIVVSAEPLHCTKHVEVAVVDAETPHQDICNG